MPERLAGATINARRALQLDAVGSTGSGHYSITVRVTDNGIPPLSNAQHVPGQGQGSERRTGARADRKQDGQGRRTADLHGDRDRCGPSREHAHVLARFGRSVRGLDRLLVGRLHLDTAAGRQLHGQGSGPGQRFVGDGRLRGDHDHGHRRFLPGARVLLTESIRSHARNQARHLRPDRTGSRLLREQTMSISRAS